MVKPTLTMIMIGLVVGVGVMMLMYDTYSGFYNDNSQLIDPVYTSAYGNISSQKSDIDTFTNDFSITPSGAWNTLTSLPTNVFSVLTIGASTIMAFLQLPTFLLRFVNVMSETLGVPDTLIWIITTIIFIYVSSMVVKAIRGNNEEA